MKLRNAMLLLTISLLFVINKTSKAQISAIRSKSKNNYFFISPLPFSDFINPALLIGYERIIADKYAISIEGGPIVKHSSIGYFFTGLGFGTGDAWWSNKGGKIRVEFKLFTKPPSKRLFNHYYSLEFFMTKNISNVTQLYTVSDTTYDYSDKDVRFEGEGVYIDFYRIHRNRYGATVKTGFQVLAFHKITIDPSIGLGIVYQSAYEDRRTNYNDMPFNGSWPFLEIGNRIWQTLTFGFK